MFWAWIPLECWWRRAFPVNIDNLKHQTEWDIVNYLSVAYVRVHTHASIWRSTLSIFTSSPHLLCLRDAHVFAQVV
jgi:hypothetical protein